MSSPFVRATCGCVVLPLGRPDPSDPSNAEEVVVLWSCTRGNPYGFYKTSMTKFEVTDGRPLTAAEESTVLTQVTLRVSAAQVGEDIVSAIQYVTELRQNMTDRNPCPE